MSRSARGILAWETTLDPDAHARLREIGHADLLIGIPSYRNGRTIAEVLRAIAEGIALYFPNKRVVLMNADGGSSDNTLRCVGDVQVTANVEKLVTTYVGPLGKGTAIRAIFEAADALEVPACVVFEARAPGITPEWLPNLARPVLEGSSELAVACYQRNAYAASLTDNLVYPFLRMFFTTDLREPLPSEFCISSSLAGELAGRDFWETDITCFGVNVGLTMQALIESRRVAQVALGYRGEGGGEPGMPLDMRFLHTVSTLFRLLTNEWRTWQKGMMNRPVHTVGAHSSDPLLPAPECFDALWDAFQEGRRHYRRELRQALCEQTLAAVQKLFEQPREAFCFPDELWAQIIVEFAVIYNKGEGDPDKITEALLPLFYGRTAAHIRNTARLTWSQRERDVQKLAELFVSARPRLIDYWNSFEVWIDSEDY